MHTMEGKIVLVTGGTSGIGLFTALELARLRARVVIMGRNELKCTETVRWIQEKAVNPLVDYLVADLSSQAQIRSASAEFHHRYDHLDVLINNAGGFYLRRKLSVDNIEMTFALNHLAYFLFTHLCFDLLKASQSARVISVSSGAHYNEHLDFNDLQLSGFYNPIHAYGRSKLANVLFAYELSRRLRGTSITSNALTPGMVATDIWNKVNRWLTPVITPYIRRVGQSPLEGAQTSIYLATSPEVEGVTGKYYSDSKAVHSGPVSYDEEIARRLWDISMDMVGLENSLI
jgi:NAD(P)-dependent dehydrogenase (short-subunit alcohol dehydrogenase family)